MYIVYSDRCLEYVAPRLPESPERVYRAYRLLKSKGMKFVTAEACSEEDLRLVHSPELIERIRSGDFFDPDSPSLPGIYEYARLSAGGAIKSMEIALSGERAFSLMRPPGHHVGVNGAALGASTMGFCYFNNVAVACMKALERAERVAILDIDCHHGNGTQEIFQGHPRVLFVSLHKYGMFYPGTGGLSEGNCLNYPFRRPVGDEEYLETLKKALGKIEEFNPDLLAVSAGFDAHREDPVGALRLSEEAYLKIGRLIADLNRNTFAVLEGGYGRRFPECVWNFIKGLRG
jgi:acetoin utilization deacetylase AcuC-like enzyme